MLFVEFPSVFSICKLKLTYSKVNYDEDRGYIEFPYSDNFEITLVDTVSKARKTMSLHVFREKYYNPDSKYFSFVSNMSIVKNISGNLQVTISKLGCIADRLTNCLNADGFVYVLGKKQSLVYSPINGYHISNGVLFYNDIGIDFKSFYNNNVGVLGLSNTGNSIVICELVHTGFGGYFFHITGLEGSKIKFINSVDLEEGDSIDNIKMILSENNKELLESIEKLLND